MIITGNDLVAIESRSFRARKYENEKVHKSIDFFPSLSGIDKIEKKARLSLNWHFDFQNVFSLKTRHDFDLDYHDLAPKENEGNRTDLMKVVVTSLAECQRYFDQVLPVNLKGLSFPPLSPPVHHSLYKKILKLLHKELK